MYRCSSDLHNDKFAEIASSECIGSYVSGGVLCSELEAHLLSVIICVIDGEVCVVDLVMIYANTQSPLFIVRTVQDHDLHCKPSDSLSRNADRPIR